MKYYNHTFNATALMGALASVASSSVATGINKNNQTSSNPTNTSAQHADDQDNNESLNNGVVEAGDSG